MTSRPLSKPLSKLGAAALAIAMVAVASTTAGAQPRATSSKQLGLNSYVQELCQSASAWQKDATSQFKTFKSVGANSVALAFPLYTQSLTANAVNARQTCGSQFQTPSPARLAVAIKIAHQMHLKVLLRPLLEETNLAAEGGWRGTISPTNTSMWFTNYLKTLTPYLSMAKTQKVESFSIAAEFDSMAAKPNWKSFITGAKKLYPGTLIFTINWEQNAVGKVKWSGTTPGMDAYQAVLLGSGATTLQMLEYWNNALKVTDNVPFSISSAAIDEVAILAQNGAYAFPYAWSLPFKTNPFNQKIQANWYTMACAFFKEHSMRGIYFWGIWYSDGGSAFLKSPDANRPQNVQPMSVAAIKNCFTGK